MDGRGNSIDWLLSYIKAQDENADLASISGDGFRAIDVMKHLVATRLSPCLFSFYNRYISARPEERWTVANAINQELDALGLVVRCPTTGRPAVLRPSLSDHSATEFVLQVEGQQTPIVSLLQLSLMPMPVASTQAKSRSR